MSVQESKLEHAGWVKIVIWFTCLISPWDWPQLKGWQYDFSKTLLCFHYPVDASPFFGL